MEISRGYKPLFKTTVKGLAKVKLPGHTEIRREEVYQIIASSALVEDDSFEDYQMLVFDDRIHFGKSQMGFSYPEIPYSSIVRVIVLPNFPDVCFIHFRRSAYGMYVVFRVRKVSYLPKLAKFISTWNESNISDTEDIQEQPTQKVRMVKAVKKEHKPTPTPINSQGNTTKPSTRSRSKQRPAEGSDPMESCEFVCIKHNHKAVPSGQARRRSHSPPQRRYRVRIRRRSYSEPSPFRDSEVKNHRPRFRSQPGTYTIIVPTSKKVLPPKGFNKRSKRMKPQQRERIIIARAYETDSSSSSSTSGELLNFNGGEVKTIYPSSMDLGRLSPKSLRNEHLIHKLRRPINSN